MLSTAKEIATQTRILIIIIARTVFDDDDENDTFDILMTMAVPIRVINAVGSQHDD
jgi:hypothetical protein